MASDRNSRVRHATGPATRPSGISVVVPFHAAPLASLVLLLRSMVESARGLDEPWECIVADDSPAPLFDVVGKICEQHGARHVAGPVPAGAKRNVGAALARYDLLLFVDQDCGADRGLLPGHVRFMRSSPDDCGGALGLIELTGDESLASRIADRAGMWSPFLWPLQFKQVLWGPTANLVVRTHVFEAVGGFDESLPLAAGGEDTVLGIRITEGGWRLLTNPEAVVSHDREQSLTPLLERCYRYGRALNHLCTMFPERVRPYRNPLPIAAGAAVAANLLIGPRLDLRRRLTVTGAVAAAWAVFEYREMRRGRWRRARFLTTSGSGRDAVAAAAPPTTIGSTLIDLSCVLLNGARNAGGVYQALRMGRTELLWRRFPLFTWFDEFVPRDWDDAPAGPAGEAAPEGAPAAAGDRNGL